MRAFRASNFRYVFSNRQTRLVCLVCISLLCVGLLAACSAPGELTDQKGDKQTAQFANEEIRDTPATEPAQEEPLASEPEIAADAPSLTADEARSKLTLSEDYRASFVHGDKGAEYQKYIMLHDTEGDADASSVINWWDSSGNLVAAHFVVNKDGSIVQCVPLDKITHHAGFGDTGHNGSFGVEDESRDDKAGTASIGDWAADYGMNSYSVGIEIVHVGGSGDYPTEQLEALDALIAYIDASYGLESQITDHKAWRSGNSDTSEEFAPYLENYKAVRSYRQ